MPAIALLSVAASAFVLLASPASAALQGSACVPRAYTGDFCKAYSSSYQTSITEVGQTRAELEASSYVDVLKRNNLQTAPTCFDALSALACGLAFPQCSQQANGTNSVQMVCETTCRAAIATCDKEVRALVPTGADVIIEKIVTTLANCTRTTSSNPEPYAPTGQCLAVKRAASAALPVTCPFPFLPQTNLNVTNKNCNPTADGKGACCVPCPVQDWLYPNKSFNIVVLTTRILSGISALLAAYVVLSWACLPGRRQHPGDIVLHFAIAVMIWQSCSLFLAGSPKRVQCADDVTVSTASNNLLCGIQGALLMCSVNAAVFWAGYMIANLHATIVWRSNVFERFKPLGVTLCWGLPGIFTFLPFLVSQVDCVNGISCLIAAKDANKYFFSVHAVIVLPSFFLNLATMIHIMIVARRSSSSNLSGGYSSNGYSGNGSSYPPDGGKPISARRQMLQLLKLNWRALFLGVVFIVTYVTYVAFYQIVVAPLATVGADQQWTREWSQCLALSAGDTTKCFEAYKNNIPNFGLVMTSALIVSTQGLWIFIIFGFNLQILYDWVNWFADSCSGRRKAGHTRQEEVEWR
ncbi:hypothetical protein HDU96_010262 [Phlyctochytrium bullatum]|nr:hypothetical protein HDU96_010262 [Phlyctochytrium bullatum]